jgi:hypothetical protein
MARQVQKDYTAISGDTWEGSQCTVTVNSSPLNLTGATIRIDFRATPNSIALMTLTTTSGITLTTPASGIFNINQIKKMPLPEGRYYYDVEITLADGTVKTYQYGTMIVGQDISRV